ncbi:DUF4157 domain-containing protein [Streptomyces sp. NPDC050508]|uniref:eCIS core domain-containing protein n=1 Tax=Streptomyces sp. NPDC050508 TaxID=3155405 RepID=UPI00343E2296
MRPRVQPHQPEKAEPRSPSRVPDSRTEQGGSPGVLSPARIAALQRAAGNAAVLRAVDEARHVHGAGCGHRAGVQRSSEPAAPEARRSSVPEVLRGPGRPLADPVRTDMEARLGADFSDVRLHTGPTAQRSAAEIGARAYTSGSHVVLGAGGTDRHTLAHELTHVIQQRSGPVAGTDNGTGLRVSDPSDRFERAAEANAVRAVAGPAPVVARAPERHAARSSATPPTGHVQRVQADEEQATAAPRTRVLVVSDVSGLGLGGVPVFNMELVKGLAPQYDVTMLTVDPDPYDEGKKLSEHSAPPELGGARPHIVNIPAPAGVQPRDALVGLTKSGSPDPRLPQDKDAFDVIIGHSRFSGPGAEAIRKAWYPRARLVHFLHTSPLRLDVIKNERQSAGRKSKAERTAMHRADLVAGVGPLLAKEAERLSQQIIRVPAVHEFVPGTPIGPLVESGPSGRSDGEKQGPTGLKLLLPGRAEDEIKGVEAAVQAIGILRRRGVDAHLTVRGGPDPGKKPTEYKHWQNIISQYGEGGVTMLPFTTIAKELDQDRTDADALIMPSLHEGFGLVATEGAGRGIPVLVNGESGAAQFLERLGELGVPSVVNAPVEIDRGTGGQTTESRDARAQAWADAIEKLVNELPKRREDAKKLRETLEQYSWQHAAQALIEAAMAITVTADDPRQRRMGAVTQQGPDGTVVPTGQRNDWEPTERWDGTTPLASTKSTDEDSAYLKRLSKVLNLQAKIPPPKPKPKPTKPERRMSF